MGYRNYIVKKAKLNGLTIREAIAQIENSPLFKRASVKTKYASKVEFTLDKDEDIMHVHENGEKTMEFKGEDLWNEAIKHFKKKKFRGELPQSTQFVVNTEKKGPVDISWEFNQRVQPGRPAA